MIYRAFGERVARRRAEMRLTQLQVANVVGLSRATIANVESGKHSLPLHQVYRLALALGLRDVAVLLPPMPQADAEDLVEPLAAVRVEISGEHDVSEAARRQAARFWSEAGMEDS